MSKITAKYIFQCKLKGKPIKLYTNKLKKADLKFLSKNKVWTLDPLLSSNFWQEYSFKINYPIWLVDSDGAIMKLFPGDRHEVLL